MPTPAAETLKLKDPSDFRYIGTGSIPIVDLYDITDGPGDYGIDAKMPGMKFAVVARPPVVGGKLVSFDAAEAMKVPGVEKVVEVQGWPWPSKFQPLGGVAVVARNTGAAIKGRDALKIKWDDGPNAIYDPTTYRKQMEATARASRARSSATTATPRRRWRRPPGWSPPNTIMPHFAHAAMEPPARRRASRTARPEMLGRRRKARAAARGGGKDARHSARGRHREHDAAGRRVRTQVEMRLRDRGRAAVEGDRARRSR